jgi:hypothetical protein
MVQLFDFRVKCKVLRELGSITPNLFIQPLCRNAIESRQVRIQQHPLTAQHHDALGD